MREPRQEKLIPALGFRWLTPAYDLVVRLTTREAAFKAALVAQLELPPAARVLDLGCGTATLTLMLKRRFPQASVAGVDGDAEILRIAREKVRRSGLDVDLREAMAQALPYADASFDCVASSLFFHHLERAAKLAVLAETRRVLKPGGALHVADWGGATGPLSRGAFVMVQLLDGFPNTADNVAGRLPGLMEQAGYASARETQRLLTVFGNISLYGAQKPHERLEAARA
ncbi:MAG: class I SAM-dependent methyltransferase [Betaproteobacteria bacterium]|nr:class I SAM-dependent methyltransferase [Betaproteobacteria bacterium]